MWLKGPGLCTLVQLAELCNPYKLVYKIMQTLTDDVY